MSKLTDKVDDVMWWVAYITLGLGIVGWIAFAVWLVYVFGWALLNPQG